jgi:hypothetical protein
MRNHLFKDEIGLYIRDGVVFKERTPEETNQALHR